MVFKKKERNNRWQNPIVYFMSDEMLENKEYILRFF